MLRLSEPGVCCTQLESTASDISERHIWAMTMQFCSSPQRDALQFEWAWQHPTVSIAVRDMAKELPKRSMAGVKGKV